MQPTALGYISGRGLEHLKTTSLRRCHEVVAQRGSRIVQAPGQSVLPGAFVRFTTGEAFQ